MTMRRRAIAVAATAAVLFCSSADLGACGDKFLRVGRSARLKGYASIHPASILVYKKANPNKKGLKEFETQVKKAGHKLVFVDHGAALAPVVGRTRFDLIIADRNDIDQLKDQLRSMTDLPDFLPLADKPSKTDLAQLTKEYHCVLVQNADMTMFDVLAEIDHAMDVR